MALVLKFVFTSLLICTSLGTEINVSFELEDSGVNEVIFVNENGIVLRCCVSGVSSEYMIRIKRTNGDDILPSAQNETCENCVEYVIKKVSMTDDGEYTCKVSYSDMSGSMETETKILNLNVHDGRQAKCFRNGTTGQPYQVNDLVLMSCYCWETDETMPCMWRAGISGTPSLPVMDTFQTISRSSKKIQRLLIQVGSESSFLNMTYICRYSSIPDRWCSIGPQIESSTDVVINSHDENTFTYSLDCGLLRTSTVTLPAETVTQKKITNQSTTSTGELTPFSVTGRTASRQSTASTSGFNVIVLGVGVLVGIGVALFLIGISRIVFILLKRRNIKRKEANSGGNPVYANKLYNMNSNDRQSQDITNRNESADSHYYGIGSNGELSPVENDSKSRDSVETNTYMRTIAYM